MSQLLFLYALLERVQDGIPYPCHLEVTLSDSGFILTIKAVIEKKLRYYQRAFSLAETMNTVDEKILIDQFIATAIRSINEGG